MSAHLAAASCPTLPLVLHLRSTMALAEAARAADRALVGRYCKPSPLRDMLVRLILIEHEEGRSQHMMFYQRQLQDHLGTTTSTSHREFQFLEVAKVIRLDRCERDTRRYHVHPTDRMLAWAAEHIPRLASAGGAT